MSPSAKSLEVSRRRQNSQNANSAMMLVSLRIAVYVMVLVLSEFALYQLMWSSYASFWIPPLVAETTLFHSKLVSASYWIAVSARCVAIVVARICFHYAYIVPFVYGNADTAREEILWHGVVIVCQCVVAAVLMLMSRRCFQRTIR